MHKQIHSFHQVSSLFHHPTTMAAVCMIEWCAVFAALVSAAEVPSIPTDFHAVVSTTSDGIFCQYPNFHEVYQDLTNNRALLVMEKSTVLLIVAPKGAAPGTKEETDMTSFTVNNDGSCSYEVNDWPCVVPRLYISQCSTIFGYPVFNKVGPWQIPNSVPGNYSGREVIKINGRNITAEKWMTGSPRADTSIYWVDSSNPNIPLRFDHSHPQPPGSFPGDDWTYQIDYLKFERGTFSDSLFAPPDNWVEHCTDYNAGIKTTLPGRQDGYLYTQPNKPGTFSIALRTRPASKLSVVINITFCNSSDRSQGCLDDETCITCATVSPTVLQFTQDNWKQPQVVTVAFNHVGVGQYKFGVSNNYPAYNHYPLDDMQFSVFSCDPDHKVPCTLPPN